MDTLPPPNPEEGLFYNNARRIKSKIRGGLGAGRGDVPHDYVPHDYAQPYGMERPQENKYKLPDQGMAKPLPKKPVEKDATPFYGIKRPKL